MAYTTIDDPSAYFQTKLYTGAGEAQDITNDGNSDLQPDLVWISLRSHADNKVWFDSVRGATQRLVSNLNSPEATLSGTDRMVTAFNSDGVSLGGNSNVTGDGKTFAAWQWKETADAGFDIVAYTGNGSNRTISHSLSAVPKMMIIKNRTATSGDRDWAVYHQALGNGSFCLLNSTAAKDDSDGFFNATTPTSSVFSLGDNTRVNANTDTCIAYLFAEKKGYSKFGSYTGNGDVNGIFAYIGFKPAFVIIKDVTGARDWVMFDNKRNTFNVLNGRLFPNNTDAENTAVDALDFTAQGFKIRSTNTSVGVSGNTYIYMAFAESPFVTSTGVPATAR